MDNWNKSFSSYLDPRVLAIFFLGFSSGLPFLLTLSTLSIWLKESGVSNTIIGLFVITTIPYTLKFVWGPLVDRIKIPGLTKILDHRRSWALFSQLILMVSLVMLGSSDPGHHIWMTALFAFCVAFSSALQDIVVEAYRIEVMNDEHIGASASSTYLGYRMGMLVSGAGALYLAHSLPWFTVYCLMAACVGIGLITTCLSPKLPPQTKKIPDMVPHLSFWNRIKSTYVPPLKDLLNTYDWRIVLTFILLYKVGDTVLNVMNTPFLLEIGFSKVEIAQVAKLFGISSMVMGGFFGGLLLNRFGILPCLLLCAMLQILSSLMFVIQALVGYNLSVLVITIGVENLTCGLGAAAFIAYLSSMCKQPHTASHFALLSSFGSMARIFLSILAGILADILPWEWFFMLTALACIPCLVFLINASQHFPRHETSLQS